MERRENNSKLKRDAKAKEGTMNRESEKGRERQEREKSCYLPHRW